MNQLTFITQEALFLVLVVSAPPVPLNVARSRRGSRYSIILRDELVRMRIFASDRWERERWDSRGSDSQRASEI